MNTGPQRAYRFGQLPPLVGVKRTQLRLKINRGEFPRGVRISDSSKTEVWFEDQIVSWQEERRRAAEAEQKPRRRRA